VGLDFTYLFTGHYSIVEMAGVEPASKQTIQMLSTCLSFDCFS